MIFARHKIHHDLFYAGSSGPSSAHIQMVQDILSMNSLEPQAWHQPEVFVSINELIPETYMLWMALAGKLVLAFTVISHLLDLGNMWSTRLLAVFNILLLPKSSCLFLLWAVNAAFYISNQLMICFMLTATVAGGGG